MPENALHQLLITLVHGTWPRGRFPRIVRFKQRVRELARRPHRGPPFFWFEEGSPFWARLSGELGDIPHTITPLLWSGENSVHERDKTAHALAEHLSAEHAEHPQVTQLIIAHSHGGNIALRALHHLKARNTSPSCAESANPLVVTLATPFVEVHPADFGRRPKAVRWAVVLAIIWLVMLSIFGLFFVLASLFEKYLSAILAVGGLVIVVCFCIGLTSWWGWWWVIRRGTARQNRVEALHDATQLGDPASTQRLLVIRAIDDEASLVLAFGTIMNYVTARFVVILLNLFSIFPATSWLAYEFYMTAFLPTIVGWIVLTILLFGMLMVSRSVHGHELALSPMECQINTQSTPDAIGLSKMVTLVRRTFVKSLRHGIYDHEDCAKVISDWVRSQLYTLPAPGALS